MKKSVLVLMVMVLSLMLTISVNDVMARSGSGGEGDDCIPTLNYKNIGGTYKGTIIGWLEVGTLKICTSAGSPLVRSNSDCTMEIPCDNPYIFGSYQIPSKDNPVCPEGYPIDCDCNVVKCETNFKPNHLTGWCRTGLNVYVHPGAPIGDDCNYGVMVSGYESIDASNPKFIPNDPKNSFTVDIVIMPLYVAQ